MSDEPASAVAAGTVVELAEEDYRYGLGMLRLKVDRVTPLRSEPGWAMVDGVVVDHRGQEWDRRTVVVAMRALRRYI